MRKRFIVRPDRKDGVGGREAPPAKSKRSASGRGGEEREVLVLLKENSDSDRLRLRMAMLEDLGGVCVGQLVFWAEDVQMLRSCGEKQREFGEVSRWDGRETGWEAGVRAAERVRAAPPVRATTNPLQGFRRVVVGPSATTSRPIGAVN